MNAPQAESSAADLQAIIDKIEQHAITHPQATEYYIEDEMEAGLILLAMAAMVEGMAQRIEDPKEKANHIKIAMDYKKAVSRNEAIMLFREMNEENQLEIYGLKLVPRTILLQ